MKQYESYLVTQRPGATEIQARQTGQAFSNLFVGIGFLSLGALVWASSLIATPFAIAVTVLGVLYTAISATIAISDSRFVICMEYVAQEGRFIRPGQRQWERSEIDHIFVYPRPPLFGKKGQPPWHVGFENQMGEHFPGEFHFRCKGSAIDMARFLSGLLGIDVDADTRAA